MRKLIFIATLLLATPAEARPNPGIACTAAGYHLVWIGGWPRWVKC